MTIQNTTPDRSTDKKQSFLINFTKLISFVNFISYLNISPPATELTLREAECFPKNKWKGSEASSMIDGNMGTYAKRNNRVTGPSYVVVYLESPTMIAEVSRKWLATVG